MVQAYILIQTHVGRTREVSAALAGIHGVLEHAEVAGPYDVIGKLQTGTVEELGSLVIARIQEVPGILRTTTCTVVS